MTPPVSKRRPVWLMVALAISLIAFEVAREGWIIAKNEPVTGGAFSLTGNATEGLVVATGTWKRSDRGSPLVPGATEIRCIRPMNLCIEATSIVPSGSNFISMNVDLFIPSEFSDSAVTYENDNPLCMKYAVRIDLAQQRVTATRNRIQEPKLEPCKAMESRVAMELGGGSDLPLNAAWINDHFLPLVKLVRALL